MSETAASLLTKNMTSHPGDWRNDTEENWYNDKIGASVNTGAYQKDGVSAKLNGTAILLSAGDKAELSRAMGFLEERMRQIQAARRGPKDMTTETALAIEAAYGGEYICKCGQRFEPHRCPDTKGDF